MKKVTNHWPRAWWVRPLWTNSEKFIWADVWLLLPFQVLGFFPASIQNSGVGSLSSSVTIIQSHALLVKNSPTFPLHSRKERSIFSPPQRSCCFLSTLQFTAFDADSNSAVAFLIALQWFLNLPNSLLVSSSSISMTVCSPRIHFYAFLRETVAFCILLYKWFPKMFPCFHRRLFQTSLSIRMFRKMFPLLSSAGWFHKPCDKMFPVDLFIKETLSIWTRCLPKSKVCGLSLALSSDWI